jgi:PhoPQ-activated pathogenicity-related protein
MTRTALPAVALCAAFLSASSTAGEVPKYVAKTDPSYSWRLEKTLPVPGGSASLIQLTSQTWQGIEWKHWLAVIRPEAVRHPEHGLLVISGGSKRDEPPSRLPREAVVLANVANQTGTVIAVLSQVPYQPLFEGLKEDGLIAHTFDKFLQTGDESWPCLLPMVKSALRAMDTVQAFLKQTHQQELSKFTVTGASKRGWTTWLTGAMDPRVVAVAPMVIDTLNMAKQMPLQIKSFGTYSEMIEDYVKLRLPERLGDPHARRLLELVDPYAFRDALKMPKLVLMGTNDPYWPVDAAKLYWNDLAGEKYLHYTPNAGHDLGNGLSAVAAITAFYQAIVEGQPRPQFHWKLTSGNGEVELLVDGKDKPAKMELWQASSPDRDFRNDRWSSTPVEPASGAWKTAVKLPQSGYLAFFAALTFEGEGGRRFSFSTNVEVVSPKGVD